MSTRSRIGYELADGRIKSTYCHSDGYPSYMGNQLLKDYDGETEAKKARVLVNIGYLSVLLPSVEESKATARNKARPSTHANLDAFYEAAQDSDGEWCYYLQTDGMWIGSKVGADGPNWLPVTEMVERYKSY